MGCSAGTSSTRSPSPSMRRPVASRCCRAEASRFYPQNWEEAFRGLRCRSSRHAPGVRSDHTKNPALLLLQTLTSEPRTAAPTNLEGETHAHDRDAALGVVAGGRRRAPSQAADPTDRG